MDNKKICPNPNGETGICYSFDRFGDRCGCVGCPLLETVPGGMFAEGDPLPGLTEQLNERKAKLDRLLSNINECAQCESGESSSAIILDKDSCKMLMDYMKGVAHSSESLYNSGMKGMKELKNPTCCICGKECENEWGNNPWPLIKDEDARCCDDCNMNHIVTFRLLIGQLRTLEDAREFIRKNYLDSIKKD